MHLLKSSNRLYCLVLIFAVFSALLSCNQKQSTAVKIGVVLPLTGDLGNFGQTVLNGIQLCVEQSTNSPGTEKVKLTIEDSQGNPTQAVSAINKLIELDKVRIVIGDLTSSATLAMAPIANQDSVLLISPTASNPKLSEAGRYFCRVWTSDDFDGRVAAYYAFHQLGCRKAAVVYINNDYGIGLKSVFDSIFTSFGGSVLGSYAVQSQETDFRTIVAKIRNSSADFVYVPSHPEELAIFVRQAKELGISKPIIANVAAEDKDFTSMAGNAAANLYFTAPALDLGSEDTHIKSFVKEYQLKYGALPDVHAAKGYDVARAILQAVGAGFTSPDSVRAYFDTVSVIHGVSGDFHFDKNGDVIMAAAIKQYQSDLSVKLIETVEPEKD